MISIHHNWIVATIAAFCLSVQTSGALRFRTCGEEHVCKDGRFKRYWVSVNEKLDCTDACVLTPPLYLALNSEYRCGRCQRCFDNGFELAQAVEQYVTNNAKTTFVARTYGWPIGTWCVGNVERFEYMFANDRAAGFNEDISQWDVSSAVDMRYMLQGAAAFDQDLSAWNTSNVINMAGMFQEASSFKGRGLSRWDVSKVTDMSYMFDSAASFNAVLSGWNTGNVKDMSSMFYHAYLFNSDVSKWNVSKVEDFSYMFDNALVFNQNLCQWARYFTKINVTSQVTNMFASTSCRSTIDPTVPSTKPKHICHDCK